jgi:hypothetical protein
MSSQDIELMNGAIKTRGDRVIVDVPKMLRHFGLPDTSKNRDQMSEIADRAISRSGLLTEVAKKIHMHKHVCPDCGPWQHEGKRTKCELPRRSFCSKHNE